MRGFSSEEWNGIKNVKAGIEKFDLLISKYAETSQKSDFDTLFSGLDLRKTNYAEAVGKIRDDV